MHTFFSSITRTAALVIGIAIAGSTFASTATDLTKAEQLWSQDKDSEAVALLESSLTEAARVADPAQAKVTARGYWLLAKARRGTDPQHPARAATAFLRAQALGFQKFYPERGADVQYVAKMYEQKLGAATLRALAQNTGATGSESESVAEAASYIPDATPPEPARAGSLPQPVASSRIGRNLSDVSIEWAKDVDKLCRQTPLYATIMSQVLGDNELVLIQQYSLFYLMVAVSFLLALFRVVLALPGIIYRGLTQASELTRAGASAVTKTPPKRAAAIRGDGEFGFKNVTKEAQAHSGWLRRS